MRDLETLHLAGGAAGRAGGMSASVLFDFGDAARQLRMLILLGKVCARGVYEYVYIGRMMHNSHLHIPTNANAGEHRRGLLHPEPRGHGGGGAAPPGGRRVRTSIYFTLNVM